MASSQGEEDQRSAIINQSQPLSEELGIILHLRDHVGEQLSERDQGLLEDVRQDIGRLRALIDDLLYLSKIESGKVEMAIHHVPVALLFEKATQNLKGQAQKRGIQLRNDVPAKLPNVKADANKVTWVLNNSFRMRSGIRSQEAMSSYRPKGRLHGTPLGLR